MPLTRIRRIGLPLVAAIAVSAAVAAPAIAVPSTSAGTGTFKTWSKAQAEAGFKLYKPTDVYGLPNVGHVVVTICEATNLTRKRVVSVSYGNYNSHNLALQQNNAGQACANGDEGTFLATERIHGIKAQLWGFCGFNGAPACTASRIELWLTWKQHGNYYVASSFNESRARLLHFAATLKAA
jgi:hypothetical protein